MDTPSRLVHDSTGLGWTSVSAAVRADPPETDPFVTVADDLLVVLVTRGAYAIESRQGTAWRRAAYRPGSIGVSRPGRPSELRWRATAPEPMESLHLRLRVDRPGGFPDTLRLDDPLVGAYARRLGAALDGQAPPLYADTLAYAITERLAGEPGAPGSVLTAYQLDQVVDLMRANLAAPITLDDLAARAHVSKFHFLRSFARTTGVTPHRYLRRMRLDEAARLLRTTTWDVQAVALACGWASAGQFAAAFRRDCGVAPTAYRNSR